MSTFLHSHSANERFNVCPASFYLTQTGAPRGKEPTNFRFGRAAHLVMELYCNHCIENGRRSDISVIGQFIDEAVRVTGMSLALYDELTLMIRAFLNVYEIDVEHSIAGSQAKTINRLPARILRQKKNPVKKRNIRLEPVIPSAHRITVAIDPLIYHCNRPQSLVGQGTI